MRFRMKSALRPCLSRLSPFYWFLLSIVLLNLAILVYLSSSQRGELERNNLHFKEHKDFSVTFVVREWEHFENDLQEVVQSVRNAFPHANIVIVSDTEPYPKITFTLDKLTSLFSFEVLLERPYRKLEDLLTTKYVFIIPDAVTLVNSDIVRQSLSLMKLQKAKELFLFPIDNADMLQCYSVDLQLRNWTIVYRAHNHDVCDAVDVPAGILIRTKDLLSLPNPLGRPIFPALFIKTRAAGIRARILRSVAIETGRTLFQAAAQHWKHKRLQEQRLQVMYDEVKVKRVIHSDKREEWYGCTKKSPRCFGTVHKGIPSYMSQGRWTPPCCLRALRKVIHHVHTVLEKAKIPYWLEGGSLLGAVRHGDILPWDYDVDIGIHVGDVTRLPALRHAQLQPYVDDGGFVWEAAKEDEGNFFRVQFSESNRLHVDIWPFSENGRLLLRKGKLTGHPQDKAFPVEFVRPLKRIPFAGMDAWAPHNPVGFLEYKFGKGVVQQPRYPDNRTVI